MYIKLNIFLTIWNHVWLPYILYIVIRSIGLFHHLCEINLTRVLCALCPNRTILHHQIHSSLLPVVKTLKHTDRICDGQVKWRNRVWSSIITDNTWSELSSGSTFKRRSKASDLWSGKQLFLDDRCLFRFYWGMWWIRCVTLDRDFFFSIMWWTETSSLKYIY